MKRIWNQTPILFTQNKEDSDIWYVELETHSKTQMQRFSNLVLGCTYRLWNYKTYKCFTRFSINSELGRKLNARFNVF